MQQTLTATTRIDDYAVVLIGEHVRRLLEAMGVKDAQVSCEQGDGKILRIEIMAGDTGSILIGPQGAHLYAMQHVIRCILRKRMVEAYVLVDVNGYRIRRERSLIGLAEEVAHKAQKTGRAVVLAPMNAVDRRAVHTALATHKDITTESVGEGEERRVIVRPLFL